MLLARDFAFSYLLDRSQPSSQPVRRAMLRPDLAIKSLAEELLFLPFFLGLDPKYRSGCTMARVLVRKADW